jgi:hypothetical protein
MREIHYVFTVDVEMLQNCEHNCDQTCITQQQQQVLSRKYKGSFALTITKTYSIVMDLEVCLA